MIVKCREIIIDEKHSKWKWDLGYECPKCNYWGWKLYRYCPNCKMDMLDLSTIVRMEEPIVRMEEPIEAFLRAVRGDTL